MDLVDPTKKMSKSGDNPKGLIRMLDDIESIRKKIMGATTDSEMLIKFDPENKPGISNLINIVISMSDYKIADIEKMFEGKNYGEFKRFVADTVCGKIAEIQKRYHEVINSGELDAVLDEGLAFTEKLAKAKYESMKTKMGFGRK